MQQGRYVLPSRMMFAGGWAVLAIALLLGAPNTSRAEQEPAQLSCFQMLQQNVTFDQNLAVQLCQGAQSAAPAECFLRVQDDADLSTPLALQLCQYAEPADDPAGCYLKARNQNSLEAWRAVELCRPNVNVYTPLP